MPLTLFNTLTGRKEPFTPLKPGEVTMYVCGPTVYDHSHIGHARAALVFDVLLRHLTELGYRVTYVRNFTDVDDKIIKRANEEGISYVDLARRHIDGYHRDMDALGALRPTHEPKATEFITAMIEDVRELIAAGHAYEVDGDVYYDVESYPRYGALSNRQIEDLRAGARVDVDERKKNPLDFALWKRSKPGEPSWESPWGPGRPGWHIECSAMSHRLLGPEFDIHGGGHDLVFPHHENEIAQSAGLGRPFARYWLHNGFVRVDNEKMSKSLNNFFTIHEALDHHPAEVIRLFLLSKHYRGPVDFSDDALAETRRSLDRVYAALRGARDAGIGPDDGTPPNADVMARFQEAMDDDLNTSKALGCVFEAVKELNLGLEAARAGQGDGQVLAAWTAAIRGMGRILGTFAADPEAWFAGRVETDADGPTPEYIEDMIRQRSEARVRRDWAEADRIRDALKEQGVLLEDSAGQTRWRMAAGA